MKPEAFRNPKFSGSSPILWMKKIVAECCQGSRWAWSYRVLQFLVWVRRPKSFSSFFWQKLEEPFWFLGCLINKKKYSNMAAWQSFLWEFSRFSLLDWLTSTIGQDTDPPSRWFQQWAQCWCVKDLQRLIEHLRLRRVFIGKNLLFQYSSGSCERHGSSEGVVQGTCFLRESKKKWDVLRWLLPTWGAIVYIMPTKSKWGPLVSPGTLMAEVKWEISNCCWRFCLFCPSGS